MGCDECMDDNFLVFGRRKEPDRRDRLRLDPQSLDAGGGATADDRCFFVLLVFLEDGGDRVEVEQ